MVLACLGALACGGGRPDLVIEAPAPGTAVAPGQEVHFRLGVEGSRDHAYQLSLAGVGPVGRAEGAGTATIPWTVPAAATPGQRFDFTASARDTRTRRVAEAATHLVVAGGGPRSSAPPPPEEWTGTWTGRVAGNIYDDAVTAAFSFAVAPDGTVGGRGTATLTTRTVRTAGCVYRHAQAPSTFPVAIAGRREGGHFALRLAGPGLSATRTVAASCLAAGSPGPPTPFDAFGVVALSPGGLAPRLPARDGATWSDAAAVATMNARYELAIRRRR